MDKQTSSEKLKQMLKTYNIWRAIQDTMFVPIGKVRFIYKENFQKKMRKKDNMITMKFKFSSQ